MAPHGCGTVSRLPFGDRRYSLEKEPHHAFRHAVARDGRGPGARGLQAVEHHRAILHDDYDVRRERDLRDPRRHHDRRRHERACRQGAVRDQRRDRGTGANAAGRAQGDGRQGGQRADGRIRQHGRGALHGLAHGRHQVRQLPRPRLADRVPARRGTRDQGLGGRDQGDARGRQAQAHDSVVDGLRRAGLPAGDPARRHAAVRCRADGREVTRAAADSAWRHPMNPSSLRAALASGACAAFLALTPVLAPAAAPAAKGKTAAPAPKPAKEKTSASGAAKAKAVAPAIALDTKLFKDMAWRSVGPANCGGRVSDFAVVEKRPATFFMATGTGGLFKTGNMGTTWSAVFESEAVASIGAVAVWQKNPDVVWAGTGEANSRNSSSWGNGVYRSLDGGGKWEQVGLAATSTIARVITDPADSSVLYVAALGRLWGENPERGVFKTSDGGKSWSHVLKADARTGACDLAMDPAHPNTLYAAMYSRIRTPWSYTGGGKTGGIFRTTDGGRSWKKLTTGLPEETGRIGLSIYRRDPRMVLAVVESDL